MIDWYIYRWDGRCVGGPKDGELWVYHRATIEVIINEPCVNCGFPHIRTAHYHYVGGHHNGNGVMVGGIWEYKE